MKDKKILKIVSVIALIGLFLLVFFFSDDKELKKDVSTEVIDAISNIATYEMDTKEIEDLPTKEIIEQTEEQENAQEQVVEDEGFELQGEIAYEGDKATTWDVELGDYKGLTYYSQLDSRWASLPYTATGNNSQTIGSSGCAPTTASMIVTATRGVITPDKMSNLFVKYRL